MTKGGPSGAKKAAGATLAFPDRSKKRPLCGADLDALQRRLTTEPTSKCHSNRPLEYRCLRDDCQFTCKKWSAMSEHLVNAQHSQNFTRQEAATPDAGVAKALRVACDARWDFHPYLRKAYVHNVLRSAAPMNKQQIHGWQVHALQYPPGDVERLPSGWAWATTQKGRVYYLHHESKRTTWVHPVMENKLKQEGLKQEGLKQEGLKQEGIKQEGIKQEENAQG